MKTPLTVHLIVKNHEAKILRALESIIDLNCDLLICDIGSRDSTITKCKKYNAKIIQLSFDNDMSKIRNEMIKLSKTKWNFYIEPWEFLLSGKDIILDYIKGKSCAYQCNILQEDLITKQIRLWNKDTQLTFANPVFESLFGTAHYTDIYIATEQSEEEKEPLLKAWTKKQPFLAKPLYYQSCIYLSKKNWDSFLNYAELYLHQEKSDKMSVVMTHYYIAMINCYIKKNYLTAIQHILMCLAKRPTMSEFWCLLADIFYSFNDYEKAKCFYENATILGSKRLKDDWPIEVSKYKEYPEKMIKSCDDIKNNLKYYSQNKKSNSLTTTVT